MTPHLIKIESTPDLVEKVAGLCPKLSAIHTLFEDAASGVEFSEATTLAAQRKLA